MVSTYAALSILARFARDEENTPDDIRAFVRDSADDYRAHMGPAFLVSLDACDDSRIRAFVAAEIRDARETRRVARSVERARDAQASCDVLSSTLIRDAYGRVDLDVISILASCLTSIGASLLVHLETDRAVVVPMRRLIDTARIVADLDVTPSLRAWLDTSTAHPVLHVRWTNAHGREAGYRWRCSYVDPSHAGATVYLGSAGGDAVDVHPEDVSIHAPRASQAAPLAFAASLASDLGWPRASNDSAPAHATL